jgi:uncharacterized protein YggU (UPF0235/DUF167 family)
MPPKAELTIRATPRARQEKIEAEGDVIRVWVRAAPADGEANKAICALLAKRLGVPKSAVSILRGESSRVKQIQILGMDDLQARQALGKPD